jgi:hypothetical protein
VSWLLTCKYDIKLTWKDTSADEANFAVRRLPDMIVSQVAQNVVTWTGTERLYPATPIAYEVRAENAAGASAWVRSNIVLLPVPDDD